MSRAPAPTGERLNLPLSPPAHEFVVRTDTESDPAWDAFVARVPGATLYQTSHNARFKAATDGFACLRCTMRQGSEITGGAQVLVKRMPMGMNIGLVPRGPLLAPQHADRMPELLRELRTVCRRHGLAMLFVQPSPEAAQSHDFAALGLTPSPLRLLPTATVAADLRPSPKEILGAMSKSTRSKVRQGLKRGLVVRKAGREQLPAFHRLLVSSSDRQDFTPASLEYFQTMWDILEPPGHAHLFVAEAEGEVVAALLLHTFGGSANVKRAGWAGAAPELHPNRVMHYQAMLWAKEQGLHTYDHDDFPPDDARKILEAGPDDKPDIEAMSQFKLSLGVSLRLLPGPLALAPRSLKGQACRALLPLMGDSKAMRLAKRLFLGRGYY